MSRRHFTEDFKKEAVKLVTEHGYKTTAAAKKLGIHESSIRQWRQEMASDLPQALHNMAALQVELKQLKKKNIYLQQELKRSLIKAKKKEAKPVSKVIEKHKYKINLRPSFFKAEIKRFEIKKEDDINIWVKKGTRFKKDSLMFGFYDSWTEAQEKLKEIINKRIEKEEQKLKEIMMLTKEESDFRGE